MADGSNRFAIDLYRHICTEEAGNIFFSPYSISSAMAIMYMGAVGDTKAQIRSALYLPDYDNPTHRGFKDLRLHFDMHDDDGSFVLSQANALWMQTGFGFTKKFTTFSRTFYDADTREVDFEANPDSCRLIINDWVSEKTGQKISNLLTPGAVDTLTRLVVTNTIYFSADWLSPFNITNTKDETFFAHDNDSVEVTFMRQKAKCTYLETDVFKAIKLPYKNKMISMIIFLPHLNQTLADLDRVITAENLGVWNEILSDSMYQVDIKLPRVRVEKSMVLNDGLRALGIVDAFDIDKANFPGITGVPDLYLHTAIHSATVNINEKGTEAAAATALAMTVKGSRVTLPSAVFYASRPFAFLILDEQSHIILFMGRVTNPALD